MNRPFRTFQRLVTLLFVAAAVAGVSLAAPLRAAEDSSPLRHRCTRVTPPGGSEPACCMTITVIADGQPVAGAQVEITTTSGGHITVVTQSYGPPDPAPYYELSLSDAPISAEPGDIITITASYSSHQSTIQHVVRSGSQHVDVVLRRNQAGVVLAPGQTSDYIFERTISAPAQEGQLKDATGVAVDSDGNVYVLDRSLAIVQVFDSTGQRLKRWGLPGNLPGQFAHAGSLAVDRTGNIYVADSHNHRVQKFDQDGELLTTWGTFGDDLGFNYPEAVAVDAAQNVYVAHGNAAAIHKFDGTGTFLLKWGSQGTGLGELNNVEGLAFDTSGNLYIADSWNQRIQKFTSAGTYLTSWGTLGSGDGQFTNPRGVATDTDGNVYVADSGNYRVQKFTADGTLLGIWNQCPAEDIVVDHDIVYVVGGAYICRFTRSGDYLGYWSGALTPPSGQFNTPRSLVASANGDIYVADAGNARIQVFHRDGGFVRSWGSYGSGSGQLNSPWGIALDVNGNVLVADTFNHRIQKFSSSGVYMTGWGSEGSGNSTFFYPRGVAVDGNNFVYVADTGNNRIQKFTSDGTYLTSFGGPGTGNGVFDVPSDLVIGDDGALYVLDAGNRRLQKLDSNGQWLATWGAEGNGTAPSPWEPTNGLTRDAAGNIYLATSFSVRKFSPAGALLANWSNYRQGAGAGQYDTLTDVAFGGGALFVSEDWNNRVQVFRAMSYDRPVATITWRSGPAVGPGQTLTLVGSGEDSDQNGAISAYEWTSDIDGLLTPQGDPTTLTISADQLSSGTHHITLRVRDMSGQWSDAASETISVNTPPKTQWTMLLYLVGDGDDGLAINFQDTLDALKTNFHNQSVRIAVQIDEPGNGDTRRLLIYPGVGTGQANIVPQLVGEKAMDDPNTLIDFIKWGQGFFPAKNYYLAIADHGQAIQGIGWDDTSDLADDGLPNDSAYLTVKELDQALDPSKSGILKIAVVHLDACSMNVLDTAYELQNDADVLIASQYLGWSYFAYDTYAGLVGTGTQPKAFASSIVERYAERAQTEGRPFTLAALDLARAEPTARAVTNLAAELRAISDSPAIAQSIDTAWLQTRKFDSNNDRLNTDADLYLDLADWANQIRTHVNSASVRSYADALLNELTGTQQPFVLQNAAGSNRLPLKYGGQKIDLSRSNGVSIFYPQQQNSVAFKSYINDQLFSFSSAYQGRWKRFLLSVSALSGPGTSDDPLPGPLVPLNAPKAVFVPLVTR